MVAPGQQFERLRVQSIERVGRYRYALCECSCGGSKKVRVDHLRTGKIRSCGCLQSETSRTRLLERGPFIRHGLSKSRAYSTWLSMKQRCLNPNNPAFKDYGGRGITICDRWLDFETFVGDMGQPPNGHTIERLNNSRGYEPGNCVWADRETQQNNRRPNKRITWRGETRTVSQWSRKLGLHRNTIDQRLANGWPLDKVFSSEMHRDLSGLALGGHASGEKARRATHCKRGHPFDQENTLLTPKGTRVCRRCHAMRQRNRRLVAS